MDKLIESLSPIEIKIIPYLAGSISDIVEKSELDKTTVLRALRFLENKQLVKISQRSETFIELGVNGIRYKKANLPERNLILYLEKNNHSSLQNAELSSGLSNNEFRVSLGTLKRKNIINLSNGKISLVSSRQELAKKFPEEILLEKLPCHKSALSPSDLETLKTLQSRKEIVELIERKTFSFTLTDSGRKIAGKTIQSNLTEQVTSAIIKKLPKNLKFRHYDLEAPVPKIHGGKKHFVNQSIEYAKKIWTDLGFKEMTGTLTESSFWNFDALFQPQDHPARELQDSFFIKGSQGKLPDKSIVEAVKKAHESGISGSKGWKYSWDAKEAQKTVLRTHTTNLSARTLANLDIKKDLPAKFFAIGKVFRNETIDWSHGIEFYQTEGIVIDPDANFRHLLGYLKEFYEKMGFKKIRFRPSYFPYTEPSVEIDAWHPEKKVWLELGGAGIFRPEVTVPLLGSPVPVLAWGQGLDRIIMDFYKIRDLREMYSNDIKILREKKTWTK